MIEGASTMATAKARKRPRVSLVKTITAMISPDKRVIIADATWDDYERFCDATSEGSNVRIAFDGKDIEIMTLGPRHESLRDLLGQFVHLVAGELLIERQAVGSTTWKRKRVNRGVESDLCYYFDPAKLVAYTAATARQSNDVKDYPNPDLAIEIDLSRSKIDRPGIYAALKVPEVWRVDKKSVSIEQLGPHGTYVVVASSRFLHVRSEEIMRWLFGEESSIRVNWEHRLREWARTELAPRTNA
jgi:Uma2 family endonuclease